MHSVSQSLCVSFSLDWYASGVPYLSKSVSPLFSGSTRAAEKLEAKEQDALRGVKEVIPDRDCHCMTGGGSHAALVFLMPCAGKAEMHWTPLLPMNEAMTKPLMCVPMNCKIRPGTHYRLKGQSRHCLPSCRSCRRYLSLRIATLACRKQM